MSMSCSTRSRLWIPMPREARTSICMTAVLSRVDTPRVGSSSRVGSQGEGSGDVEKLLVALRQGAAGRVKLLGEAEQLCDVLGVPTDLPVGRQRSQEPTASAEARQGGGLERFQHGQLRKDLHELEAPSEPEPREAYRPRAPDVASLEAHDSGGGGQASREHVDERGLD